MSVASDDALPHTATLKDGSKVLIRRAGPEDFKMLFRMFSVLSNDTMFRRFLRSKRTSLEKMRKRCFDWTTQTSHHW